MAPKDKPSSAPKTPSLVKHASSGSASGKQQKSILGFFSKGPSTPASTTSDGKSQTKTASKTLLQESARTNARKPGKSTPCPSSDAMDADSGSHTFSTVKAKMATALTIVSSPSHRAEKKKKAVVNYAESEDESEDEPLNRPRGRRQRPAVEDDDDDYDNEAGPEITVEDMDGDEDELEEEEEEEEEDESLSSRNRKRKRASAKTMSRKRSPAVRRMNDDQLEEQQGKEEEEDEVIAESTAKQWLYDADRVAPVKDRKAASDSKSKSASKAATPAVRGKAHTREPEDRYPWLAKIRDLDGKSPGEEDYDPSTVYVPPNAWKKFSAFEKQYWEIKHKLWDTVVFFKKGKFYELYENDATIGHQLFDLKLTDRVNMRMVGVPESSLDIWVNQFIAKGFKVARVEQTESALGKEMREREGPKKVAPTKADKIIHRELACILTAGTLVDGAMLQDDNATYCTAIKESVADDEDGSPLFGIAFVDTATGQFYLSGFKDDVDLTKFETLIAQTTPRELLLEKGQLSVKTRRILKNSSSPTTLWNWLKPGAEFWDADTARRELNCNDYFSSSSGDKEWPKSLQKAKDNDVLMSAVGALVQYLRMLKIDRNLISQGSFNTYSPIHKKGTLILDGQTLMSLDILSNSTTGGSEGSLLSLLNRCVTPFGKRLFRRWLCHPLCDTDRIDERLDAVDVLNENMEFRDQFTASMASMPDLERLVSRIHAGAIRPDDFVKVLDGFEQIRYTMTLLSELHENQAGKKDGLVYNLVADMPNLKKPLKYWSSAFSHAKARNEKLLIPSPGIEADLDANEAQLTKLKRDLTSLLDEQREKVNCRALKFTDIGKEIYQIEAPKSLAVPKSWNQMSATSVVKRYYFPRLKELVRQLLEVEETHAQLLKETAARFCRRFDRDADLWNRAIRVVANLDCLCSLAKSSATLAYPSCRPEFVDAERSVLQFDQLRHPCIDDFVPNDIVLGGESSKNIALLTGANAAGKSTVLRMSCVAVLLAQIGHHVPASRACLSPVDRIMSRLGAHDHIFASQSTFFVELAETKKILDNATPRSLVILDELGRGTSSYDGLAVAQATLHHVASHVGCLGFFATHYRSLAEEFAAHPEVKAVRMAVDVDEEEKRVTFLYRLEEGISEGSFGMHCANMCGVPGRVVQRAEEAAREWEVTGRLRTGGEAGVKAAELGLGWQSDVAAVLSGEIGERGLDVLLESVGDL